MARWQDSYAVGEHVEYRSVNADCSVTWAPAQVIGRTQSGHLRVRVRGSWEYSQFKKTDIRKIEAAK